MSLEQKEKEKFRDQLKSANQINLVQPTCLDPNAIGIKEHTAEINGTLKYRA
jgi:hypothetical protein